MGAKQSHTEEKSQVKTQTAEAYKQVRDAPRQHRCHLDLELLIPRTATKQVFIYGLGHSDDSILCGSPRRAVSSESDRGLEPGGRKAY